MSGPLAAEPVYTNTEYEIKDPTRRLCQSHAWLATSALLHHYSRLHPSNWQTYSLWNFTAMPALHWSSVLGSVCVCVRVRVCVLMSRVVYWLIPVIEELPANQAQSCWQRLCCRQGSSLLLLSGSFPRCRRLADGSHISSNLLLPILSCTEMLAGVQHF